MTEGLVRLCETLHCLHRNIGTEERTDKDVGNILIERRCVRVIWHALTHSAWLTHCTRSASGTESRMETI